MITMIACLGKNRELGKDNRMPWHLPADLKFFKANTFGHTVVMGRKTFESIGKALPGRKNIVLTRDQNYTAEGCQIVHDKQQILDLPEEVFIIGGATIYEQFMPDAEQLILTIINRSFEADTYFPEIDESWQMIKEESGNKDEQNPYDFRFCWYQR